MVIKRNKTKKSRAANKDSLKEGSSSNTTSRTETGTETSTRHYNIGLDISTSVVGICAFDDKGKLAILEGIKLGTSGTRTLWEKADLAIERINEELRSREINPSNIRRFYVESAVKRFSSGYSSADTILTLARFNAIISYLCYKTYSKPVVEINVSSARKAVGFSNTKTDKRPVKEKVFEHNVKTYPDFPWKKHLATRGNHKGTIVFNEEMKDASDALVIVLGGVALESQETKEKSGKTNKTKENKGKMNGKHIKTNY